MPFALGTSTTKRGQFCLILLAAVNANILPTSFVLLATSERTQPLIPITLIFA